MEQHTRTVTPICSPGVPKRLGHILLIDMNSHSLFMQIFDNEFPGILQHIYGLIYFNLALKVLFYFIHPYGMPSHSEPENDLRSRTGHLYFHKTYSNSLPRVGTTTTADSSGIVHCVDGAPWHCAIQPWQAPRSTC